MTRTFSDESVFKDIYDTKVDKETGKGLSKNDFTDALKSKLNGIAPGATANDTDSNLKSRDNHTGTQAISTVTGLQTALDDKASASSVTALAARVTALENWKSVMAKKAVSFTGTTDANGDITVDLTSAGFTSTPAIAVGFIFNNNNYGSHFNVKALSTTSVQIRVMRNKNTSVGALGGDVDPDEPLASTAVRIIATEF